MVHGWSIDGPKIVKGGRENNGVDTGKHTKPEKNTREAKEPKEKTLKVIHCGAMKAPRSKLGQSIIVKRRSGHCFGKLATP